MFSFTMESEYVLCANSKTLREVLNGNFPEDAVKRMSNDRLEAFVLRLVKYTSLEAGAKAISMVSDYYKENVLFEELRQKKREFRVTLFKLIIKCCEFFRNQSFKQKWLPSSDTWVNDENFNAARTRGIKRKKSDTPLVASAKKRRTLLSKNETAPDVNKSAARPIEAVVCLYDILRTPTKDEPPTQQQFLKKLGLNLNNNHTVSSPNVPQYSKFLKLHNCPHIPLSSDIGKAIIKRENYNVPDYVTSRKIERVEWYVNKETPKKVLEKYEVSYVETKFCDYHYYRFPKRQFHQIRGNVSYTNFLLKLCKPLKVVVQNEDLIHKKKYLDSFKIRVRVNRLSSQQLQKYICKDFKIVLTDINNRQLRLRSCVKLKSN